MRIPGVPLDLRMRPRFRGVVPGSIDGFMARLRRAVSTSQEIDGSAYESSAVLRFRLDHRRFWSPQLHLSLEPDADTCRVLGLLSPHPTIWSFFLALYLALAFAGLMGVTFGLSQYLLGQAPVALWSGPAAIVLSGLTFLAARAGRGLGAAQSRQLVEFLVAATGTEIHPP